MTRPLVFSALLFAALTVYPAPGDAQARPEGEHTRIRALDDVKQGARLRVMLADPQETVIGRLRGFAGTGMILEVDGKSREITLPAILRADESYRDRKRGAIVGVLVAVVGVYAWDFFGPHPRYTDQDKRYKENVEALAIGAPVMGLLGGAIGWHRWRPVSTAAR